MALFGKRKEKEESKVACCSGGCDCESMEQAEKARRSVSSQMIIARF